MGETTIHANGSWLGDAADEFKKLPTWGKIAAGGVVLVVAYLGYRSYASGKNSATTGGTSGTGSTLSSGQVATGQDALGGGLQSPFAQVPSGPNATSVPVLPAGLQPVFDGVGNLLGWQPQGPTSPPDSPVQSSPSLVEQIRARFSQSGANAYDQKFAGVPLRATPGGQVTGTAGFGSDVTLADLTPVKGPSNFGGTSGSSIWYKTASGQYVSQYDVNPKVQPVYNSTQPPATPTVGR